MQHEIEFTANEWFTVYTAVGRCPGRDTEDYARRSDLWHFLCLTDEEKEAIGWYTMPLPNGEEAPVFDGNAVITRTLTSRQLRLCLQAMKAQIELFRPDANGIVLPALKKLGWVRGDTEEED